jgi:structural protein KPP10_ORF10
MPTWSYDPAQVSFSLVVAAAAGLEVSAISADDYGEGTFITVSRARPMWSKRVGSTGAVTRSKSNDRSGSVTLMLEQGSAINDLFTKLAAADDATNAGIAALLIKDQNGNDLVSGKNAWVVGPPDQVKANEAGTVSWVLDVDVLDIQHGGLEEV